MKAIPLARPFAASRQVAWGGLLLGLAAVAGLGLARSPWLAAATVLGAGLLLATLARPVVVLGAMLVLGPLDLSFLSGGFKGLLAAQGGLDMNGIRLIGLVMALSAVALVDRQVTSEAFQRHARWYVAFLLYATATLAFTDAPVDGLRLLLKLAYPFLLFVAVLGVVRERADLERLGTAILAAAAVMMLVVAPVLIVLGQYEIDAGRLRIPALGLHENPLSFYLLVMSLMAFARFEARRQVRYLALAAVFLAWIAATMTRITVGAALASLVGFALFAALSTRNYRAVFAALAATAVIGIALLPMALQRTFGHVPTLRELVALAKSPSQLFLAMNWQGRQLLWPVVLQGFLQHPITGRGIGSSTALLQRSFPPGWAVVVHNEYLRLLSETGLVGVGLFALALGRWWTSAARVARGADRLVREFALPAFAGMLAWAVISLTDNALDYYAPFTQYIAFLSAAAIAAARLAPEAPAEAALQTVPLPRPPVVRDAGS